LVEIVVGGFVLPDLILLDHDAVSAVAIVGALDEILGFVDREIFGFMHRHRSILDLLDQARVKDGPITATDDRPRDPGQQQAPPVDSQQPPSQQSSFFLIILTSFCSGRAGLPGLAERQNPEQSAPAGGDQRLQASGAFRPLDIGLMC